MQLIQLTRRMVAKIDDEDLELVLAQGRWQAVAGLHTWYAATSFKIPGTRKNRRVLLHRLVMGCVEGDGKVVDHKNEDGLDCQKENLRVSSHSLNAHNRSELLATNNSGVEGVYWNKQKQRWVGEIIWQKQKVYCGSDENIEVIKAIREDIKQRLLLGEPLEQVVASRNKKPPGHKPNFRELSLDDL